MPSSHVTDLEIEHYRERRLAAAELVVFSDHVAQCAKCRRRLSSAVDVRTIQDAANREWEDEADHVPESEVQAYVDRTLSPSRQLEIEHHLEACASCAAEIRDLQSFAASYSASPRSRWPVYAGLAVAAGLLLAIAIPFLVPRTDSTDRRIVLSDVGNTIVLNERDRIDGLAGLTDAEQTMVSEALRTGRLEVPPAIATLKGQRGTLLGEPDTTTTLRLLAPIGTAVIDDRPVLRWTSVTGAVSYHVMVRDQTSGESTSSPPLQTTEWQSTPLARGRTYIWQVVADTGGAEVVAPRPPAPPAMFSILESTSASSLERLGPSHLARGVLYARAGALDDAERELTALAAQNPDSAVARALLDDLRATRSSP